MGDARGGGRAGRDSRLPISSYASLFAYGNLDKLCTACVQNLYSGYWVGVLGGGSGASWLPGEGSCGGSGEVSHLVVLGADEDPVRLVGLRDASMASSSASEMKLAGLLWSGTGVH